MYRTLVLPTRVTVPACPGKVIAAVLPGAMAAASSAAKGTVRVRLALSTSDAMGGSRIHIVSHVDIDLRHRPRGMGGNGQIRTGVHRLGIGCLRAVQGQAGLGDLILQSAGVQHIEHLSGP